MDMELKYANEVLNINGVFVDKCIVNSKYFWIVYNDGVFVKKSAYFDTVQRAFDDAVDYLVET